MTRMTKDKTKRHAVTLTHDEAKEVIRALELIMQEDDACNVNMDPISVRHKRCALRKLEKAFNMCGPAARMDEMLRTAKSVNVKDVK